MITRDSLQRFVFENSAIRGEIVHLDATWRAVLDRRDYPPALQSVLGEAMAAATLLAATIKFDGRLSLQAQGNGPVTLLFVECTSERAMRALAQWGGEIESGPLSQMLGDGKLAITIELDGGKERYQGIVPLQGECMSETLEHYFSQSGVALAYPDAPDTRASGTSQLDTRLWLAANVHQAAGMLLQKLPTDGDEADSDVWARAVHLGSSITPGELLELPVRDIIQRLYHEQDIRLFSRKPVSFSCSCSRDRVGIVLRMLGEDEVRTIVAEKGKVSVACEFCGDHYEFDRVDSAELFAADVPSGISPTRH